MRAAVFDLDGLLVDSEPTWRRVEVEVFAEVGLVMTEEECARTMGLRIDEVVAFRHREQPWASPSQAAVVARIVDAMVDAVRADPRAMPGATRAIDLCAQAGLALAVASSSPARLIHAALDALGMRGRFSVVRSAEHEPLGKPHPAVFLAAAAALGVSPLDCVVLEDSLNGVIAAKAARMRCIAVPERADARFAIADVVLPSLDALEPSMLG